MTSVMTGITTPWPTPNCLVTEAYRCQQLAQSC